MLLDRRTAALAGGAVVALAAMALSACAPVGSDGYGNEPVNAAAAGTPEPSVAEPSEDAEANSEPDPVAKQAPEDLTEQLIGTSIPKMGKAVTDEKGWILYRFDKDTANPPASNCNDECERVWPPAYTDGNPVVKGISDDLVGTVTRDDGTRQLTIDGWPVYRYIGDKKPGQWKGQGVGGVWFVVAPNGKKNLECLPKGTPKAVAPPPVSDDGAAGGESSNDSGGYNY